MLQFVRLPAVSRHITIACLNLDRLVFGSSKCRLQVCISNRIYITVTVHSRKIRYQSTLIVKMLLSEVK